MVITLKLDKNVKKSGLQTVYFQLTNGKYVDMLKNNIDWSLIKPPTEPINEDF